MRAVPSQHPGQDFKSRLNRWRDWTNARASGWDGADTHHGMEINLVESGRVTYLFGGRLVVLPMGRLLLFWGATPHRIIDYQRDTRHHWLEIPLAGFLQWRLPDALVARLLRGELVAEPDPGRRAHDRKAFHGWHRDLASSLPVRRHIVALEVEARLRRLALSFEPLPRAARLAGATAGRNLAAHPRVERMARYVAEHYTEPVRLAQVARVASLRPNYATTLFKKVCGLSLMDYVTQHRLSHARRLLLTTDDKVLEIALQSGFGSASRFYEAFSQGCGESPRQYRKRS